jgi:ketosteroid isomerase-like protein
VAPEIRAGIQGGDMSSRLSVAVIAGALLLVTTSVPTLAQQLSDAKRLELTEQIARAREDFARAYAQSNVDVVMSFYDKDATFAGTLQPFWLEGADAIRDLWTRYFAAYPRHVWIPRQPRVAFFGLNGETAVETGYLEMYMQPDGGSMIPTYIRYSMTRIQTPAGWKIVNMNVARLPAQ